MSWTTGTRKINGSHVHYLRTGGQKPPLMLLHGLMLSGACWTPLARMLEDDYDVIMPDARGHGYSSAPLEGYCYEVLADDAVGLIKALELFEPILLGHSMGGMTAALAAQPRHSKLKALILADPTFLTPKRQREVYKSDVAEQHRKILNRPWEDYLAERRSQSHRSLELIDLFAKARFQTSIHAFEILRPPNPDYVQLVSELSLPSLLIIGESGSVVSAKRAKELARLNSHLEVVKIPQAGHAVPFDQPEHFFAAIKAFLRFVDIDNSEHSGRKILPAF